MTNIIEFTGDSLAPLPPDKVLEEAIGNLKKCVVVGIDKDGEMYVAASDGEVAKITHLLSHGHRFLLNWEEEHRDL